MTSLSDKILYDWWYRVGMFPMWMVERHRENLPKWIRCVILVAVGSPWFLVFSPLTFLVIILVVLPLAIWEDC